MTPPPTIDVIHLMPPPSATGPLTMQSAQTIRSGGGNPDIALSWSMAAGRVQDVMQLPVVIGDWGSQPDWMLGSRMIGSRTSPAETPLQASAPPRWEQSDFGSIEGGAPVFTDLLEFRLRVREIHGPADRAQTAVPSVETHPFHLLRAGFAVLLILLTGGLLLSSFAMATNAGPLVRGLAVTALWAGQASLAAAAHMEGRKSGVYLFGERISRSVMILAVGMTIVAIVATIEFSLW